MIPGMKMMYSFGLSIYQFLIALSALTGNEKAKQWIQGRKNQQNALQTLQQKKGRRIWIHCSSLGEFEQGRPLIEAIREHHPSAEIILSFFSPSGYEIRKNYPVVDHVFYLPLDGSRSSAKFLDQIQPDIVFFIKYEYWHFYLNDLCKRKVPVYVASAIFRPGQIFFAWYGGFFRKMLRNVSHFFVQDEDSMRLLSSIGLTNVTITGDTRFDRVEKIADQKQRLPQIEQFARNHHVFVCGSTWPADETLILSGMKELFSLSVRLIIVPHEVSKEHLSSIEQSLLQLFPDIKSCFLSNADSTNLEVTEVIIVDSIGLLSSLYRYAHVAYIGGGFGKGIHNILEAAAYGIPVIIGPKFEKFKEARDLVNLNAAFPVNDKRSFLQSSLKCFKEEQFRIECGNAALNYIKKETGATFRILEKVPELN